MDLGQSDWEANYEKDPRPALAGQKDLRKELISGRRRS
jgi:hypothetical protein